LSSLQNASCILSDKGDVFGWGNSEYAQLSTVAGEHTMVNVPHHLNFPQVGRVVKAAASGSMCLLLNGWYSSFIYCTKPQTCIIICTFYADQGDVYVWGFGIVGLGPKVEQINKPTLMPPTLFGKNDLNPESKVADVQAGLYHFTALTGINSFVSPKNIFMQY
jgi:hypothetical protein